MSSPCSIPAGIQCIDSNNCLIVLDCDGSYQKVLKSTDKGKSWIILSADSLSRSFFAMVMSYPSNNYIYVGATRTGQIDNKYFMQAVIWRTYDGGKLMMKHH
ncbi:MAG: hypothetical protein N2319_13810 [Candidatus Kapabacteria bacterium]|nr:hypothetical protein [Candidatus Kapabacteria bacterium]